MNEVERIITTLRKNMFFLREKYRVRTMGIFGSYIRGEQKKGSDVDVLVEFEDPVSLFEFMELEEYLEKLLGIKVDLVSKKALKPRIEERILREVVNL